MFGQIFSLHIHDIKIDFCVYYILIIILSDGNIRLPSERGIIMKIKIYQINTDKDEHRLAFFDLEATKTLQKSDEIDSSIYDIVYTGEVDCITLEDVYRKFNTQHPEGYKGWSLSVSDVVEVIESDEVKPGFYFCDSVGFAKVTFDSTRCGVR